MRTVVIDGVGFSVDDRPGIPAVDAGLPSISLVAEHATIQNGDRVLVAPCGNGLLGAWAGRQTGAAVVACLDSNVTAMAAARATLDANGQDRTVTRTGVPSEADGPFDVYLMLMPKGRDLARLWLLNGALAIREGGRIVVAGPNNGGIQSFAHDAEALLGTGRLLAYKASNRVFDYRRPVMALESLPEAFIGPGMQSGTFDTYTLSEAGRTLTIYTRPGVFSRDALDEGTRMLLSVLLIRPDDTVLDLGCGAGVIGLVAAVRAPDARVTLVDVDSLAVECARATLRRNGAEGPAVVLGDGLAGVLGQRFSLIVTNPPFHAGHRVHLEMTAAFVRDTYDALLPGGRLVLVANRFLPYEKWLRDRFDRVEVLAGDSRYQVYAAHRALA
jgi:16S rRNA (guanine1207-N2)-methyltransferase